jgi:hypothetical protein
MEVSIAPSPGENVRRRGEDLSPGQMVLRRGQVMRPLDAAVAAAAGLEQALVQPFGLWVILDPEHRAMVEPLLAGLTISVQTRVVPPSSLSEAEEAHPADVILAILPPASDAARRFAETLGSSPYTPALRGAETVLIGHRGATPALLAPPRLDVLVPLILGLVEPFAELCTDRAAKPVWRRGALARKLASPVGVTEVALLRETMGGLEPLSSGPITLSALAQAEGYLVVKPQSEGWPEGAEVEAYPI